MQAPRSVKEASLTIRSFHKQRLQQQQQQSQSLQSTPLNQSQPPCLSDSAVGVAVADAVSVESLMKMVRELQTSLDAANKDKAVMKYAIVGRW